MNKREEALWVIDVDRRLMSLRAFGKSSILHPSDISRESGRSVQNISHGLHELEDRGLVECIDEKSTWKKYIITERGKRVLEEVGRIMG